MRLLFLHRYFPGPFRHLAAAFGSMPNTTVLFLSERGSKDFRIPGVRRLRLAPTIMQMQGIDDNLERESAVTLRQGAKAANAMLRLRQDGFIPDIVYGSASEGLTFYVRDIFPETLFAVRADWFYTKGESHNFFNGGKPRPPADFALPRIRNLNQYNALADCDVAITSSLWQKEQYPDFLQNKIQIVHDGVDTSFFSPAYGSHYAEKNCDLSHAAELVSFSSRYVGPSRGFPQFSQCLPRLLSLRPRCHILFMFSGAEEFRGNENNVKLLQDALDGLSLDEKTRGRIHVVNFSSVADYHNMLRASTVHVYLTAPSALSSGLFEAMSSGALVVGSDTPPVREVIRHGENGFLCDFWDVDGMADTLAGVLERSPRFMAIREAARETIIRNYNQKTQLLSHRQLLLDFHGRKDGTA
jgi:glycosyltransferase involved in cell wall biosynthesis